MKVLQEKARIDGVHDAWIEIGQSRALLPESWESAFHFMSDEDMKCLWRLLTQRSGGSRQHWWSEIVGLLGKKPSRSVNVEIIPAIREVGKKGSQPEGFGGQGLIERLARLQNPSVNNQADRQRFEKISAFLQSVTDNPSARIEVPYERDTIVVHMDGKAMPLDALGTGIHEVIILAAASTIPENTVVCMEEPEIHLNPVLQRKLIRYLASATDNQYFIATHSAALMDTPDAEIYHVQMQNGQSL